MGESHCPTALRCSVIVPFHQGGSKFEECICAVLAALEEGDELIAVSDGFDEAAEAFAVRAGARLVPLRQMKGPGRARNVGAAEATGELLFFVDSDVLIQPDCLRKIRTHYLHDPGLSALIGSYDLQPREQNTASRFKNLFHHWVHQQGDEEASTFWGACGAIRREVFAEVGGFSPEYERPSIEDIEFGYRLREKSHRIRLARDIQVTHLKRWGNRHLIRTDLLDRAVPWTELILSHFIRRKNVVARDLNLGFKFRLSMLVSNFTVLILLGGLLLPKLFLLLPLLGLAFFFLHYPLLGFFREQCGWKFAIAAGFWRFAYDLYSALGFAYGSTRFAHGTTMRILSNSFTRIDKVALGAGFGALGGLGLAAITGLAAVSSDTELVRQLRLLDQFLPGYRVDALGVLIALGYGASIGFCGGFTLAFLRNFSMRLYLAGLRVFRFFDELVPG